MSILVKTKKTRKKTEIKKAKDILGKYIIKIDLTDNYFRESLEEQGISTFSQKDITGCSETSLDADMIFDHDDILVEGVLFKINDFFFFKNKKVLYVYAKKKKKIKEWHVMRE